MIKEIDLSTYVDDANLSRLVSGAVNENGLATFTRDDNSIFTVDLSNLKGSQVKSDFNQTDETKPDFIKGFPLAVLDYNGVKKFDTKEIQFDKYFDFNVAEKEVRLKSDKFKRVSDRLGSKIHNILGNMVSNVADNYSNDTNRSLGDVLLSEEKLGKRIFNFEILAAVKWRNFGGEIVNVPNYIKQHFYLQPIGASFIEGGVDEKILIATIEASESDLLNVPVYSTSRYNLGSIITKKQSVTPGGDLVHEILVDQKKYDINGALKSTAVFSTYLYDNNSTTKRELDTDVSFKLISVLNVDYNLKSSPTPWSSYSVVDNYQVDILK